MSPKTPNRRRPAATLAVALAMAVPGLAACGGGGGGGDGGGSAGTAATAEGDGAAQGLGEALSDAGGSAAAQGGSGAEGGGTTTTAAEGGAPTTAPAADLPPPTIPPEASPPTTMAGTEPATAPGLSGGAPLIGQVMVDLEPDGYLDFPVHLRQGQHIEVLSVADDGVITDNTLYAPDGSTVGQWRAGEPETVSGYYWDDEDVLPATGTYVFRVVHIGGDHRPIMLNIYGDA